MVFEEQEAILHLRAGRMFIGLMIVQWIICLGYAKIFTGNVYLAFIWGAAFTVLPVGMAISYPKWYSTRHVVAAGQMLMGSLMIHLAGFETHYHIFGTLAFLALYRDWRVIATASAVTIADHCGVGHFWPHSHSLFQHPHIEGYRWVEFIAWILFTDAFLCISILQSRREMHEVAERQGLEIANERALHARDAAVESERLKTQFLASMSHEIRTPMNGVIGMTHLLLDTPLDDQQREFAQTIHNSGTALLAIINDILDYSKIESGKLAFEAIDFDLEEIVSGSIEVLLPAAQKKNLPVTRQIHPSVPPILRGDGGRIRQVMINLIGNAIKFTAKGSVAVEVTLVQDTGATAEIRFSVKDTGIGISALQQPLLFHQFSQADSSTTRKYGGTGLGLAISRTLVERMLGKIGVTSEPGQGSEFWFTMTLEKSENTEIKAPGPVEMAKAPHQHVRVLVAEDNPVNQLVIMSHLRKLGYAPDAVGNGLEVLDALQRIPYHIVLMDCQMPEMDGYESTRVIRKREVGTGRHTWIIAVTANAMAGDQALCLAAGMDEYLSKPVRVDRLAAMLASAAQKADVDLPVFSSIALSRLRELPSLDGSDTVGVIIELFRDNGTRLLERMKDHVASGAAPLVASDAHQLKGSGSQFGAAKFQDVCVRVERTAKAGDLAGVSSLLPTLNQAMNGLLTALEGASSMEAAK